MSPGAPTLRPYQTASLRAVWAAYEAGQNRQLVKAPTGTGKTVTFAAMLQDPKLRAWLERFPVAERKLLIVAHREELLDQSAEKIQRANPHARVSIEQADRYASSLSDVVIASIQTLAASKFKRLERLLARHRFRIVIVDEAHHAAAPTYRTALVRLGFLPPAEASSEENLEAADYDDVERMKAALEGWDARAPKDQLLVGFTATPNRSDAIGLGCVFQTISFSYGLKQAIDDGWLVPIVPWVIETQTSLDQVRLAHGDFNQRDLGDAVNDPRRNELAVAGWLEHAEGRPTLAFTVNVAHAHALAETFNQHGIPAAAVSGETPRDERRQLLADFTAGRIRVLANCMVLTEGVDLPATSCILHAKPTKSATLYEQMSGRGLRLCPPDKHDCIILDVVDIARRHSLQTAPVLYGLPPNVSAQGLELRKLAETLEVLGRECPNLNVGDQGRITLEGLNALARTFDVWKIPSMGAFGTGLAMRWIRMSDDLFRIQYPWLDGNETLTVEKNLLGTFDVVCTLARPPEHADPRARWLSSQRTIVAGAETAHLGLQLAEQYVAQDRRDVTRLKDREAPWRKRPASPKQLELLGRWRVPVKPGLSSGEASDLIDLAKARRAHR